MSARDIGEALARPVWEAGVTVEVAAVRGHQRPLRPSQRLREELGATDDEDLRLAAQALQQRVEAAYAFGTFG